MSLAPKGLGPVRQNPARIRKFFPLLMAIMAWGLVICDLETSQGSVLPAGFAEETITGPWTEPVGLAFDPGQQTPGGRIYVWERAGRVWIVENGIKATPPLIDLSEEVGGWRDFGLLGFAFH